MRSKVFGVFLIMTMLFVALVKPVDVLAGDAAITVSVSGDEYEKGETFEVSVTTSSSEEIIASQFNIIYDSSVFSVDGYDGVIGVMHEDNSAPFTSKTSSYTFRVIGTAPDGSAISIELANEGVVLNSLEVANTSTSGATVKAIDHRASDNANLSSLSVSHGYLDPGFSSDRTDYMVNVDNGVTSINIDCQTADANAKVSYSAERFQNLSVGENTVPITVTAENGSTKVYYVTVMRKEGETERPTEKETEKVTEKQTTTQEATTKADAANTLVTVNNVQYKLVTDISDVKLPEGYEIAVSKYASSNISVARNSKINVDLAYLLDSKNVGAFYVYDSAKKTFTKFVTLKNSNSSELVVLEPETALSGFAKEKFTLDGQTVSAYISKDIDQVYFFYAVNNKGERGWYSYDAKEGTIQRAYSIGSQSIEQITTKPATVATGSSSEISSLNSKVKSLEQQLLEKNGNQKNSSVLPWVIAGLFVVLALAVGIYAYSLNKKNEEQDELLTSAMEKIKKLNYEASGISVQSEEKNDGPEIDFSAIGREEAGFEVPVTRGDVDLNDEKVMSEIDKALKNIAEIDDEL